MEESIKIAVLAHISAEIAIVNDALKLQRSKNNLIVAFGPFVVLWGISSNTIAKDVLEKFVGDRWIAPLIVILVAYVGLGLVAAMIEEKLWVHANHLRNQYTQLAGIDASVLECKTSGLYISYILIFFFLGMTFAILFSMLVRKGILG